MSVDIVKKIKTLKKIKPRAEWKEANRDFLLAEIRSSAAADETWANELAKILFPWRVAKLVLRPAVVFFSMVALILGSGISVSAAQFALPGDALYSLKIATERVQVALTFKEKDRAKIHVELAGKRISEVKQLKQVSDLPEKKIKKINVAIEKFKEEINAVKNQLDDLRKAALPEEMVEVAKIVDAKTSEYKEALVETKSSLADVGEAAKKINQSADLAEETGDKALAVIVEKHTAGEVVLPEKDVLQRVEKKIENTEAKVAEVNGQIQNLPVPSAEQVQQTAVQAQETLVEAREALSQKNVSIALDKAMVSKELVRQAEQLIIEAVVNPVKEAVAPAVDANLNANSNTECLECDSNNNCNENINVNLDVNAEPAADTNVNTNTVQKVYPKVAKPAPAAPSEPEVIDESQLKVGIDLKQEPTSE